MGSYLITYGDGHTERFEGDFYEAYLQAKNYSKAHKCSFLIEGVVTK